MNDSILIIGEGLLADFVYQDLTGSYKLIRRRRLSASSIPKSARIVVLLNEDYDPSERLALETVLHQAAIPWIGAYVVFDEGIVGPFVRPGVPGCSQCASTRLDAARQQSEHSLELQMRLLMNDVIPRDRTASHWGLRIMSGLVAAEVIRMMNGQPLMTDGSVYLVHLKKMISSLHAFLPDPLCQICGLLPVDLAEEARIQLQPSPKINSHQDRSRPMDELALVLERDYWDARTGLMNALIWDVSSPYCDVQVNLPLPSGNESTSGRSHTYKHSKLTAIMEGLERYCGVIPRGRKTSIHDTYLHVSDHALNPLQVGLYSQEQYEMPDFPYEPFNENTRLSWVWGYSLIQERSILVPEELAYYSTGFGSSFVAEGSNGSALGGSLEEAIFYGIMEVVERDAFLLTWYAQLPLPRLDPETTHDAELLLMIHRLRAVAGYELSLFNMTMDTGIPSIWAVGKNKKETGANLICAAGAHLDPLQAAKSAIFEIAGMTSYLDRMYTSYGDEYVPLVQDAALVSEMPDHAFLYTVPEAEERLQFLLRSDNSPRRFEDEFKPRTWRSDLTEDLKVLLDQFRRMKLDVIVINQTTAEIRRNGLHCVKVIIPGMLPMTFGHHLKRVTGLERVLSVPMSLGYTERRLTYEELNAHPHPFL